VDVANQDKIDFQRDKFLKREGIDQSNIIPEVSIPAPQPNNPQNLSDISIAAPKPKRRKKKTEIEKLLS